MGRGKRRREEHEWAKARAQADEDRARALAEAQRAQDASTKAKSDLYMLAGPVRMAPAQWEVYRGITGHQRLLTGEFTVGGIFYEDETVNVPVINEKISGEDTPAKGPASFTLGAGIKVHWDPGGHFVVDMGSGMPPKPDYIEVDDVTDTERPMRAGKRNLRL